MTEPPYHAELARGDVLDDAYRVVRLIAQGGMGHVYEAEQLRLERRVALKILSVDPKKSGEFLPRFRREAEICARLSHPNIIAVLDWNITHGMPYLVMEYLEGEDLGMRLARGPMGLEEALYVIEGIAVGLEAAHAHGVVHRDLKPSNIFLSNVGMTRPHIKLLDFGVSKVVWEATLSTTSPKVLGSPRYMAPEQARGDANIDARVDQFALGTVAYEMFAGQFAFDGDSLSSVLYRVVHEPTAPLDTLAPGLPTHVIKSIARAMEKEPAKRFESIAQFLQALRAEVPPDVPHTPAARTAQIGAVKPITSSKLAKAPASQSQTAELGKRFPVALIAGLAVIAVAAAIVVWRLGPRHGDALAPHTLAREALQPADAPPPSPSPQEASDTTPQNAGTQKSNAQAVPPLSHTPSSGERATSPIAAREAKTTTPGGATNESAPRAKPTDSATPVGTLQPRDATQPNQTPRTAITESAEVKRLLDEAQKLSATGDHREAIVRARQALGYDDVPRAHRVIAIAYCKLGSIGDARAELFSVRAADKLAVVKACSDRGIDL